MIFDLAKEIQKFLEGKLSGLYSRVPNQGQNEVLEPPKLFIGALPAKKPGEREDFPFVIVRPLKGSEGGPENSQVTVKVICGVYTAENIEAGYNDLLNMVFRINASILENRILAGRYEAVLPITWKAGDGDEENQPHPLYLATITTNWNMPAMMPDTREEYPDEY